MPHDCLIVVKVIYLLEIKKITGNYFSEITFWKLCHLPLLTLGFIFATDIESINCRNTFKRSR